MQTITPELEAILKGHFQAGASGFRSKVHVGPNDDEGVVVLAASHISIDKSRQLDAAALEVEIPNEEHVHGWANDDLVGQQIRVWQWYGEDANTVRTFTGIVDQVIPARDPDHLVLQCRDRMAIAIDEGIELIAPQHADETGSDRTTANYVYLGMEVADIVADLLDKVGWLDVDRDITPTSYVVDEFLGNDGESHLAAIKRLLVLVGYGIRADENGIAVVRPAGQTTVTTTGGAELPVHVFRPGIDLTALQRRVDLYDIRTRVKVTGPFITVTLADAWTELWHTNVVRRPVGIRFVPGEALRVVDRVTRKLYWVDRAAPHDVIADADISAACASPAGLSGDPDDGSVYWLLNAPWVAGGPTTGNTLVLMDSVTDTEIDTYPLRDGRLTAMKVSGAYVYVTDWDADEIVICSKVDGSEVGAFSLTVDGEPQVNPTGIMVDGTTLFIHFDGQARFVKVDEGAPTVVTGIVATAGSTLVGGEMDTSTHTECYGDSDALGLVAAFTLAVPVENQTTVAVEVVDSALEDTLGGLMGIASRDHPTADADDVDGDGHAGDGPHSYAIRRETLAVDVITSMAQARETALRRLAQVGRLTEVFDAGVIGNPALQVDDVVAIRDALTGVDRMLVLDTYRTAMDAAGTFVGVVAAEPRVATY